MERGGRPQTLFALAALRRAAAAAPKNTGLRRVAVGKRCAIRNSPRFRLLRARLVYAER